MSLLKLENNKCPHCGRFMKVSREAILKVDGSDSGEVRTIHRCSNKSVDHECDAS